MKWKRNVERVGRRNREEDRVGRGKGLEMERIKREKRVEVG